MVRLEVLPSTSRHTVTTCFNSIMVRLEGLNPWYLRQKVFSFNSIMVRLEGKAINIFARIKSRFQFHYGSIGSSTTCGTKAASSSFNSIMVRLEDSTTYALYHADMSFNSIMVRLEALSLSVSFIDQ